MPEFTFTPHALSRILDMAFTAEDVRNCLERPEKTVPSREHEKHNYQVVYYCHGKLTLAVRFDTKLILTALWNRIRPDGSWEPRYQRTVQEDLNKIRESP